MYIYIYIYIYICMYICTYVFNACLYMYRKHEEPIALLHLLIWEHYKLISLEQETITASPYLTKLPH